MTRLDFEGIVSPALGACLALLGAVAVAVWYFRETRNLSQPLRVLLPTLRACAVAMMIAMLTGPVLSRQWLSGSLAHLIILVDESKSMELEDFNKSMHRSSRISKDLEGRAGRAGLLSRLQSMFRVQVLGFGAADPSGEVLRNVWDSASDPSRTSFPLHFRCDGERTAIGEALDAIAMADAASAPAAVVVLSDGQSNSGAATTAIADRLRDRQIPVYTVGYGRRDEPEDAAVLEVDHPKRMFATDVLQGTATIKQQLARGTKYRVIVQRSGRTLWSDTLEADGNATRLIDYRIEGKTVFHGIRESDDGGPRAVPLDLEFMVQWDGEDAVPGNNRLESSLWGVTHRDRILVIDERGRWELRYIKNAFERDTAWHLDAILGPDAWSHRQFPRTREELFALDVLIVSVDTASAWSDLQKHWVADHVAESGAGFIAIDSGRDGPQGDSPRMLDWLPVSLEENGTPVTVKRLELSRGAWSERAFSFESDEASNAKRWESFPAPRVARRVVAKRGTEVLVAGRSGSDSEHPMIVASRFGQGRVVYLSSDESWRWRYNVADLYHQRFWNQLAQWTMQQPYAMENEFASFDTGDRTIELGTAIPIRARLRNPDHTPMTGARAYAVIQREGVRWDSIPLAESSDGTGLYSGFSAPMPRGEYSISLEVPGIPVENIAWQGHVQVRAAADVEMLTLSQNGAVLGQLAERTGGVYVDESEIERLIERVRPRQSGKIEESRWALWQSFPWFVLIVGLLSVEWFLRKRAGLV